MTLPANLRGWGHPDSRGYAKKYVVKLVTLDGVPLWVRREVAPLFQGFLDEIVLGGYRLKGRTADDWGYNNRDIRGRPGVKSNHAWGLAVDLNALTNPMRRPFTSDMPRWVVDAGHRWGFFWGGDYDTTPDPMHYEFLGYPADVRKYPIGRRRDTAVPAFPAPIPLPQTPVLEDDVLRPTDVTGVLKAPNGGWWMLQFDGGIICRGSPPAPFYGSYPGLPPEARQDDDGHRGFLCILKSDQNSRGYMILSTDGGIYRFNPR